MKPLPLQAFLPAQALCAVLQALVPLHALAPTQWPLPAWPSAFAAGVVTAPASINEAAAAARVVPDVTVIFILKAFPKELDVSAIAFLIAEFQTDKPVIYRWYAVPGLQFQLFSEPGWFHHLKYGESL